MKNKLRKLIENADWYVDKITDGWELSKYSPAGEDFCFCVRDAYLYEDIKNEYENFDADEHAEMWIDNRDVPGVPQSIRDIIDDADAIKENLKELLEIVGTYFNHEDFVKATEDKPDVKTEAGTKGSK